jgi:hypothetical protein
MGAPIKSEFLLLYLIIKMSSILARRNFFCDAFPVKGRQNSVKILHRSQSSLPMMSFSSGGGLYFRFVQDKVMGVKSFTFCYPFIQKILQNLKC